MTEPIVKAEGVHKSYGRLEVLKGISMEVAKGEVFCILGPSGSGKSTFLRCINHLEKINAGRIYVDGDLIGYRERDGKLHEVRVVNVCGGGAMITAAFSPMLWEQLQLNLGEHGSVLCSVIWIRNGRLGLEFAEETRLDCADDEQAALVREVILLLKRGYLELSYFDQKFGVDVWEHYSDVWQNYVDEGLVRRDGDRIELTMDGLLRADAMLPAFFEPEHQGVRYT